MKSKSTAALIAVIIPIVLIYASISLISAMQQLHEAEQMQLSLLREIEEVEAENAGLLTKISDADREAAARERLGLVEPGEIIFFDISNTGNGG